VVGVLRITIVEALSGELSELARLGARPNRVSAPDAKGREKAPGR
jgi:hypothetical protein